MKPPFSYYGGKTRVASRITQLLPAHEHYVEPFAGSLAVLLAKEPVPYETANDLNQDLLVFWRVLRDRPEELVRVCGMTPHSRAEHQMAFEPSDNDLEHARRVWTRLAQGRTGRLTPTGWRRTVRPAGSASYPTYLAGYVSRMEDVAERLRTVSLECRPALEVVEQYGAHDGVLIYADPPYLSSTRTGTNYQHELAGDTEHQELAAALHKCRAAVVLSGYRSPLYDDLYADWHTAEIPATTSQGNGGVGDLRRHRVEALWSNVPLKMDDR